MANNRLLRIFEPRRDFWPAVRLGLMMIAAAATEGIGLMLIAPMLMALGATGGQPGSAANILSRLGLPISLTPMLALFVALVLLRGIITHFRHMASQRFEMMVSDGMRTRALDSAIAL